MQAVPLIKHQNSVNSCFTTLALSNFGSCTFITGCTYFVAKALALTFSTAQKIRNVLFLQSVWVNM
jgi:hypothetical protein